MKKIIMNMAMTLLVGFGVAPVTAIADVSLLPYEFSGNVDVDTTFWGTPTEPALNSGTNPGPWSASASFNVTTAGTYKVRVKLASDDRYGVRPFNILVDGNVVATVSELTYTYNTYSFAGYGYADAKWFGDGTVSLTAGSHTLGLANQSTGFPHIFEVVLALDDLLLSPYEFSGNVDVDTTFWGTPTEPALNSGTNPGPWSASASVNITTAGTYKVLVKLASDDRYGVRPFDILVDGNVVATVSELTYTYNTYSFAGYGYADAKWFGDGTVSLTAGSHTLGLANQNTGFPSIFGVVLALDDLLLSPYEFSGNVDVDTTFWGTPTEPALNSGTNPGPWSASASFNVTTAGTYKVRVKLASDDRYGVRPFNILVDGNVVATVSELTYTYNTYSFAGYGYADAKWFGDGTVSLTAGSHTLGLANQSTGFPHIFEVELLLVNVAPVAVCQNTSVNADDDCHATVQVSDIDGGSYDPDGDAITLSVSPSHLEDGVGEYTVTLTVSDGELSDSCEATVTVVDTTPPVISTTDPGFDPVAGELWPPNHRWVAFTATDICDVAPLVTAVVGSGELTKGAGGSAHNPDILLYGETSPSTVSVRAERSGRDGKNSGRIYTITAVDASGNIATLTVTVPHDQK